MEEEAMPYSRSEQNLPASLGESNMEAKFEMMYDDNAQVGDIDTSEAQTKYSGLDYQEQVALDNAKAGHNSTNTGQAAFSNILTEFLAVIKKAKSRIVSDSASWAETTSVTPPGDKDTFRVRELIVFADDHKTRVGVLFAIPDSQASFCVVKRSMAVSLGLKISNPDPKNTANVEVKLADGTILTSTGQCCSKLRDYGTWRKLKLEFLIVEDEDLVVAESVLSCKVLKRHGLLKEQGISLRAYIRKSRR